VVLGSASHGDALEWHVGSPARGHALLRRHEFDAGPQPAAQRLDRGDICLEMLGQFDQLFHLAPVDRLV
jgi:hypothetical protein